MRTYAFRIGREAVLLDDDQWSEFLSLLMNRIKSIMDYRKETGCSIEEARKYDPIGQSALDKYEELSGIRLEHPDQLWGVRMRDYGSLCPSCSKPFRTPRAKLCAECGFTLPSGLRAGELADERTSI